MHGILEVIYTGVGWYGLRDYEATLITCFWSLPTPLLQASVAQYSEQDVTCQLHLFWHAIPLRGCVWTINFVVVQNANRIGPIEPSVFKIAL